MSVISASLSSKSKIAKFSSTRERVTYLGKMMSPRCTCQRSVTWAGDLECASAIRTITGSFRTPPCAIGYQASVAMPCSASKARTSSLVR